jgi:Cap4 SAVED domain
MASLSTDKLKKENAIITSVSDLDGLQIDPTLCGKIRAALSNRESIDNLKSKIHIPILILHECGDTAKSKDLSDCYKAKIKLYHQSRAEAYFSKQMTKAINVHKYDEISFHIILFPVPNKKKIIDSFVKTVAFFKDQ